jgi:hypothetical protein
LPSPFGLALGFQNHDVRNLLSCVCMREWCSLNLVAKNRT